MPSDLSAEKAACLTLAACLGQRAGRARPTGEDMLNAAVLFAEVRLAGWTMAPGRSRQSGQMQEAVLARAISAADRAEHMQPRHVTDAEALLGLLAERGMALHKESA